MKIEEMQLLHDAIENGSINLDVLYDMKKIKVNEVHTMKITPPKTIKGRWQTYVPDEVKGKRKKVSAKTERDLYEKLYTHYYGVKIRTLTDLYPIMMEKRKGRNLSDQTLRKNENHWKKHYENSELCKMPLHTITADDIEIFFYTEIRKYDLKKKAVINVKTLISEMFWLAMRMNLIISNPMNEVKINYDTCNPKTNESEYDKIYLPQEKEHLFNALNSQRIDSYNVSIDAIFFLFKFGLRLGELVALKDSDIDYEHKRIHINRMETSAYNEEEKLRPIIVEHVKMKSPYGDRYLPLSDYDIELLKKIRQMKVQIGYGNNPFLFVDKYRRVTKAKIDHRLRKYCAMAGIPEKSAHDIRRTVATELYLNHVPLEDIQRFLGHSCLETTRSYIFDLRSSEEKDKIIVNALQDMNGLKGTQNSPNKKMLKVL